MGQREEEAHFAFPDTKPKTEGTSGAGAFRQDGFGDPLRNAAAELLRISAYKAEAGTIRGQEVIRIAHHGDAGPVSGVKMG